MRHSSSLMLLLVTLLSLRCVHNQTPAAKDEIISSSPSSLGENERNQWLTKWNSNVPSVTKSGDSHTLKWLISESKWPVAEIKINGTTYTALIDSGSSVLAFKEDSNLMALVPEDRLFRLSAIKSGSGSLGYFPTLKIEDFDMSNVAVSFLNQAVSFPPNPKMPTKCCDAIIGQNILRVLDVWFNYQEQKITLGVQRKCNLNSAKITQPLLPRSNHWTTEAEVGNKICKTARVDTANGNLVRVFAPWYGTKRPERLMVKVNGLAADSLINYSEKPDGYVYDQVCANLNTSLLFQRPLHLSLGNQCMEWGK